ncbi:MAG: hypothetical protein Q9219_004816 [cf. Caloplaca sp. 3 TL-2023]
MSYHSGYNYSPYYSSTNDGRGQDSYQNSTNTNGRYTPGSYGSSNTHTSQQQPPSYLPQQQLPSYVPPSTATDRSTVSYSRYGGTSGFADRSPVATTALGNLAHASSLEQNARNSNSAGDNRSLQQIIDYNRSQTRFGNSASPVYATNHTVNYGHQRSDSRGAASPGVYSQRLPATDSHASYSQNGTSGGYNSPTFAYSTGQSATTSYVQSRNEPTAYRTDQAASQQRLDGDQRSSIDRRISGSPAQISNSQSINRRYTPTTSLPNAQIPHHSTIPQRTSQDTPVAPSERRAAVSTEQVPATVDPNHVFNHQEYQRRQAAEEERIRKAAEAEEIKKAAEAAAALKRVSESQNSGMQEAKSPSSREEQMAAEMRDMIEKMRDYKSKDPSLFSQIWEQVKKTNPPGSIPAPPPISAKDIPSTSEPGQANRADSNPALGVDEELPDLGRFPAQRRRRGGKNEGPARKRKSTGKPVGSSTPQVDGSQSSPPVTEAENHPRNQATPTPAANGMFAGQDHQVVYVSAKGPKVVNRGKSHASPPPPKAVEETPAPTTSGVETPEAQPAHMPVQPPTAAGRTNWPEHKKWDLAVAAKNILLAMPTNSAKAKTISPEQILAYLNQNPSYERLCQMIESRGLIIERGHFARCLLEAVPGMGAGGHPQRPTPAPQPNIPQLKGSGFGTVNLRYLDQNQQTVSSRAPQAQMTPNSVTPTSQSDPKSAPAPAQVPVKEDEPKAPMTKQEMARKRNIVDIVDLSQMSDDELPPPPKVPRLDVHPPNSNQEVYPLHGGPLSHQIPSSYTPANYPPLPFPAAPHPPPFLSSYPHPAPPPPLHIRSASPSAQQRELTHSEDIVRPIDEQKVRKRKRYNPKTIVRDVLVAAGRHPTMHPLNHHLDSLRKIFKSVNDMADLDTFRWDLVDPGDPPAVAPADPRQVHGVEPVGEADGNEADDEEGTTAQASHQGQMAVPTGSDASVSVSAEAPHTFSHAPKLLGPHRKRKRRELEPHIESGLPKLYRMGPSGLRTSASVDGVAIVVPSPTASVTNTQPSRGRGRPKKSPPKTSQQSTPIHRVYKCYWKGCPAELHNLETLRKHVKKHGDAFKEGVSFPCLWKGCGIEPETEEEAGKTRDEEPAHQPLRFDSQDTWIKHMESKHVADYAWKLGDGPSIRSDSEMSDYVSDSAKRQVTPVISNEGRPDPLPLTSSGKPEKVYHKAHGITTESGKAQAFLEASERRRQSFGPGIDRGGATFVTKRKNELLDDSMGPLRKVLENEGD